MRLYFVEIPLVLANSLVSQLEYQNHEGEIERSHPKQYQGPLAAKYPTHSAPIQPLLAQNRDNPDRHSNLRTQYP